MGLIDTEPKEGHCMPRSETDSRRKIEFGDHGCRERIPMRSWLYDGLRVVINNSYCSTFNCYLHRKTNSQHSTGFQLTAPASPNISNSGCGLPSTQSRITASEPGFDVNTAKINVHRSTCMSWLSSSYYVSLRNFSHPIYTPLAEVDSVGKLPSDRIRVRPDRPDLTPCSSLNFFWRVLNSFRLGKMENLQQKPKNGVQTPLCQWLSLLWVRPCSNWVWDCPVGVPAVNSKLGVLEVLNNLQLLELPSTRHLFFRPFFSSYWHVWTAENQSMKQSNY